MRTLGRYELLRPLARGGMAEVYLARRRVAGIEKRLVIKRLRRERIADPRFLDLFVKEAQLSMALVQQNIVPVFDFGRIGDDVFLAMEHIDGKDLGSSLSRQKGSGLPPLVAAFVAAECCHALHHAHTGAGGAAAVGGAGGASGSVVVHRDVTPRNVLLSWTGEVKLADFGIAAAIGAGAAGDTSLVGTPAYLAPEQARGQPVDARTDLYSLGLVLWEMLVGERVRSGNDATKLLAAASENRLPPLPSGVPAPLAEVIRRVTATDPRERLASAREMADSLDVFIIGERARHGGPAPAQQLAAWLRERWAGVSEDAMELAEEEGGAVATFLDDGAAGVLGTGTLRSMAVTAGPADAAADSGSGSGAAIAKSSTGSEPESGSESGSGSGSGSGSESGSGSGSGSESGSGSSTTSATASAPAPAASTAGSPPAARRRLAILAAAGVSAVALGAFALYPQRDERAPRASSPSPLLAAPSSSSPSAASTEPAPPSSIPAAPSAPPPASASSAALSPPATSPTAITASDPNPPSSHHRPSAPSTTPAPKAPKSSPRPPAAPATSSPAATPSSPSSSPSSPPSSSSSSSSPAARRAFTIGARPWAHFTVDGEARVYETPATVELALGAHRIRYENPTLGVVEEVTITVTSDGPASHLQILR